MANAPVAKRRPGRPVQRASFVIILMGVGAVVAALVSAAMSVRYDASASVSLPDRLDSTALVLAGIETSFTDNVGQSLDIAAEANSIRFIGSSGDPVLAASTANAAAIAFVDGLGDADVAVAAPAATPSDPASPRRMLNLLIGVGLGGFVGLLLQAALRPPKVDESVTYVPTWTAEPTWPDDETHETHEKDEDNPDEPEPEVPVNNEADSEIPSDARAGAVSADAPQVPAPALDVPAPPLSVGRGFRDLVGRTSANLDPLIDRFAADDDQFEADLDAVAAPASDDEDHDEDELVNQIAFLGDEITVYQRRMDDERTRHRHELDELIAEHEREVEALRSGLEIAQLENERIAERRDSTRSQLEDRVTELETSLAASNDQLERARRTSGAAANRQSAATEDLATEIEFMRSEVERYQRTLDEERVAHSTAVAAARLENQDELDRIHREHRVTLNQLAQTNRNLLTAQRNEAESVMAELEANHQRSLDEAHRDYEQRLADARTHHSAQLAKSEARTRSAFLSEQSAEIEDLREQLKTAQHDVRTSQERTAELEAEVATSDRRAEQAQLTHAQAERRQQEESRGLKRRSEEIAEVLRRTEQRLADERKRTNEVVRNLLRESASAATAADWARRSDIEVREETATEQRKQIESLQAQLLTLEQTAAGREATLEATISELRRRLEASPNG